MKLARSNVTTKHFQLQPEYKGTRQIRVTVYSIPRQINRDVLAAYMSAYSTNKEVTAMHLVDAIAHSDFVLNICLNREGFQAIPHILTYRDQQMMVVMEGRRPLCWSYKLGHLLRTGPQNQVSRATTSTVTATSTTVTQEKLLDQPPILPWNLGTT